MKPRRRPTNVASQSRANPQAAQGEGCGEGGGEGCRPSSLPPSPRAVFFAAPNLGATDAASPIRGAPEQRQIGSQSAAAPSACPSASAHARTTDESESQKCSAARLRNWRRAKIRFQQAEVVQIDNEVAGEIAVREDSFATEV